MASNIPLGSFLEDGVRVGPLYAGEIPNGSGPSSLVPFNPSEVLSYSSYSAYGPGILMSAQNTWNITPALTTNANIVAPITAAADINNLPLTGDNVATKLITQSNSNNYVQFDWPRVPIITITTANLDGVVRVTIFGFDWYGLPMQHKYTVQNVGQYPLIVGNEPNFPVKAFYSVTRVSMDSDQFVGGATFSIGASDIFGLPFLVNDAGDITSIGWGNSSDLDEVSFSSPVIGTSAAMAGGAVVVRSNDVTETSNIQVTRHFPNGGPLGNVSTNVRVVNQSFTIQSDTAETSTFDWMITNPNGQYPAVGVSPAMVAGVVTIFTSQVQANSNIQLTMNTFGNAHGQWYVSSRVPGVSFTVTSTDNSETSTVSWAIMPENFPQGTSDNIGTGLNPVAGQIFVNAPSVTASSNILLTYATNPDPNGGVLSAPFSTQAQPSLILPGKGFTIISSNNSDSAKVNWAITNLQPGITQGTNTLAGGTVTVNTKAVQADSVILLTYNTLISPTQYIRASSSDIVPGTSFIINAQAAGDVSTVNWAVFPANFFLKNFVAPLGIFVPADQTSPPTSTTGDVRGLYGPSTPSNGVNVLRFTSYVQGADQWLNQVSNNQFLEGALNQQTVGTTILPLTPQDLYGVPEYYTGNNT